MVSCSFGSLSQFTLLLCHRQRWCPKGLLGYECIKERPPKINLQEREKGLALLQAARDRNAAKRAAVPPPTTEQSTSEQQKEPDEMIFDPPKEPFKYNELPKSTTHDFCAFGELDKQSKSPWLVGNVGKQSTDYGLLIRFDVGLSGFPCMKFQRRSALKPTGKPLTRGDPFDGFYVDWFLPPPEVISGRSEEFTYEDFDKWTKGASLEIMALPQIQDINKNGMYVKDPREIQQLHHPRFFTPVQSLQVFMGITKAKKPTWATKLFYKTPSTKPRPRRWPESPSIFKLLTLSSRTSS